MIVKWEGRDWEWRPDEITVEMARKIKTFTGMGLRSWQRGIDDGDPDCLAALLWALKFQNEGETHVSISQLEFPVPKFYQAIAEAAKEEIARLVAEEEGAKFRPKGRRTPAKTPTSAATGTAT